MRARTKFYGPILTREADELLERQAVRSKLNVADGKFIIYLTAGGGGDPAVESQIRRAYEALRTIENAHFVVGAGSLYRGARIYAANVTWLCGENALELMPGFDAAVAAAGYNTFHELMFAGVPTVFVPQPKWADDQFARAERAERIGAAFVFKQFPEDFELRRTIETLGKTRAAARASNAAKKLVPANFAKLMAADLLQQLIQQP